MQLLLELLLKEPALDTIRAMQVTESLMDGNSCLLMIATEKTVVTESRSVTQKKSWQLVQRTVITKRI